MEKVNNKVVLWKIIFFVLSLICSQANAQQAEEEFTAFDIYLGDSLRGIAAVRYQQDNFTFDDLPDLMTLLPLAKDVDKTKIEELLKGSINKEREIQGIGKVTFYELSFKVKIELSPELLAAKDLTKGDETIRLEAKRAFRQDMRLSHVESTESSSFLNAVSLLSLGKPWIKADYGFSDTQKQTVREVSGNMILGKYKLGTGMLRGNSRRLTPTIDYFGGSIMSAQEKLEGNVGRGSYFQIYVPSRSRVEFYRKGQLIDTQVLEFGLQEIDTTQFPDGSYYIDVLMVEFSGGSTRKRVFFTKSGQLAPRGMPLLSIEGGMVRKEQEALDIPVSLASIDWRILSNMELELTNFYTSTYQITNLGFKVLYDDFFLSSTVGIDSDQSKSYAADFSAKFLTLDFGGTYEHSKFVEFEVESITKLPDQFTGIDVIDQDGFSQLQQANELASAYVGKQFSNFELRLEAYRTVQGNQKRFFYGPLLRYSWNENPANRWLFEVSYNQTDAGQEARAYVGYQASLDHYAYSSNATAEQGSNKKAQSLVNALSYDTVDSKSNLGTRAALQNNIKNSAEVAASITSMQIDHGRKNFGVSAFAQNAITTNNIISFTGATSIDTSFVVLETGKTAFAPASSGDSLLVVTLDSSSPEIEMEIVLNSNPVSRIKGGGTVVLGVAPYRKYTAGIRPAEKSILVDYDSSQKNFVLYPGDVAQMEFKVEPVFVALGKIVDVNNVPLKLKRLKGVKGSAMTDETGGFQAEVTANQNINIESTAINCSFTLPDVGKVEYFYDFGTIVCK